MKAILITMTIALISTFGVSADTFIPSSQDQNLYASVISFDAKPEVEIVKIFNNEIKNPESKISKYLSSLSGKVAEVNPSDLIITNKKFGPGLTLVEYLLPIRVIGETASSAIKQIAILYISDLSEEEIGLSTRIYFQGQ